MRQAIAGVAPAESGEATIMVVWPSIAAFGLGRFWGRLLGIRWPNIYIFRIGVLLAPVVIPFAIVLYFYRLLPSAFGLPLYGTSYRLTNRRVIEQRNEFRLRAGQPRLVFCRFVFGAELKSVQLDHFDAIEIVQRPGQHWYNAGDLVFRHGARETFRLSGVSRPEGFRQACLKAHLAYVGVKKIRERQTA